MAIDYSAAIDLEAAAWAEFFKVTDEASIEARRQVMRANVAVGYVKPLLEFMRDKVETITLPAHWASALINGDTSGLDDAEIDYLPALSGNVVDVIDGSKRFTWHYRLYAPFADCDGGMVADYVVVED